MLFCNIPAPHCAFDAVGATTISSLHILVCRYNISAHCTFGYASQNKLPAKPETPLANMSALRCAFRYVGKTPVLALFGSRSSISRPAIFTFSRTLRSSLQPCQTPYDVTNNHQHKQEARMLDFTPAHTPPLRECVTPSWCLSFSSYSGSLPHLIMYQSRALYRQTPSPPMHKPAAIKISCITLDWSAVAGTAAGGTAAGAGDTAATGKGAGAGPGVG